MVEEVHPEPDKAFSGGRQSLTLPAFVAMMRQVEQISLVIAEMTEGASMGTAVWAARAA